MMQIKFTKTIRGKLFLYTSLIFLSVLGSVVAMYSRGMYVSLIKDLKRDIALHNDKTACEIDSSNIVALSYTKTMAFSQEAGMFGKREDTLKLVYSVIGSNPQFYDSYVIYEPNADGQDANFRGKPGCDAAGRFNAVVNNIDGKLVPVLGVGMETGLYYQGAKENHLSGARERYMITEPYLYEGVMMVEHTYPIVINGNFAGVCGVDRTLTRLTEYLSRMKPYETADFILVSRLGGIISATMDTNLNTRKIGDTPYHDVLGAYYAKKGEGNPRDVREAKDSIDGRKYFYTASSIRTGDWLLVMRVSTDEVMLPIRQTLGRVVIVAVAGITVMLTVLLWICNSITNPIRTSVNAAKRIASGDLSHEIEKISNGETGLLLAAIRTMTRSLRSLVGKVQQSCIQVTTSATEIAASARELEATIAEQAASTSQVSTAASEISISTRSLAETMSGVSEAATEAATLAGSGRTALQSMEARMQQLVDATRAIGSKLALISEKAISITQIITTITKLADQTNLLSLNAAIEAEKAGEAGLGFSVVAREIRRLSDQTAVAAMGIERMVQEMQSAVSSGVMGMEKFSEDVRHGMKEIDEITVQMEQIIGHVEVMTPRFAAVNDGMQSQSQVAHQISEAMLQLNEAASQTSNSVREFNQAAGQLRDAVQGLREEVSRFKVTG